MRYYYLKPLRPSQYLPPLSLNVAPAQLALPRQSPENVATFDVSLNRSPESPVLFTVTASHPSASVSPDAFVLESGTDLQRSVAVTGSAIGPDSVSVQVSAEGLPAATVSLTRPPFVPVNLTGLSVWYDASDPSTVTLDASNNIEAWANKSGASGRTLGSISSTTRPAWPANVLGGRHVARYDGIDDMLRTETLSGSVWAGASQNALTVISLMRYRNTGRASVSLCDSSSGTSPAGVTERVFWDRQTASDSSADIVFSVAGTSVVLADAPIVPVNTWSIESARWTSGTNPTLRIYRSGSPTTYSAASPLTGTFGDARAFVGAGTRLPAECDCAEFMAFSRALSDAEVAQIEAYLVAKWGAI